ncbi:hypothetical protein EJ07DRAFT_170247 [Lizonia empirigonia]|nr:hypothetical protein EJ07DRAFT_170247 [Lizonia empirigonia]
MIGRADIEGSKSNVAMNAWLPQASYPCGSIGHTFMMCRPSQNSPPDNVFNPDRPTKDLNARSWTVRSSSASSNK